MRIAVIGAGFAGLAAADHLHRNGADVAVFEARDRVGGRVWSQPFAGAIIERGAEFIMPGHDTLLGMAKRLGLVVFDKGMQFGQRQFRGGIGFSADDYQVGIQNLDRALRLRQRNNRQSITDFFSGIQLSAGVRQALLTRIAATNGYPSEQVDVEALGDDTSDYAAYPTYTIAGGNQQIAQVLAKSLPHVQLNCSIDYVVRHDNGYRVGNHLMDWHADAVVLAVPVNVLRRMQFEPQLPHPKQIALANVTYGYAAKLFVALKHPVAPSAVMSAADGYWTFTGLNEDGVPVPLVGCFGGPEASLQAMAIDDGPEKWLKSLALLRPELPLDLSQVLLSSWHNDPWVGGVYSVRKLSAPVDNTSMVAQQFERLHFCGEHTSQDYYGYMEGALQSGLRAAQEILQNQN